MAEPITQEKLAAAIFKAKGLMENAVKASVNPHFKNSYADFGAVRDATMPALTECGLSIEQRTGFDGEGNYMLFTWFQHISGAKSEYSFWPIIFAPDKPQVMGSSLTYARRYQWGLVCGIASEKDDDGEKASELAGMAKGRATKFEKTGIKSAYEAKMDGDYPKVEAEIRACKSVEALKKLGVLMGGRIIDWPDTYKRHIREEYARRMTELEEGVTEDGDVENVR